MKLSKITSRNQFGELCQSRGYLRGVEIGIDRADFALQTLKTWPICEEYWGFDPYESVGEGAHCHPWPRNADLTMACVRLAPYVPAVRIIQMPGANGPAMLWFKPDFVYIDGLHDYESVQADIACWWPSVAPGGILAGHDYSGSTPGVMQAVDEFIATHKLRLHLTMEDDFPVSWWVEKPK